MSAPVPLVVHGGAGGIVANRDDIEHLTAVVADAAEQLAADLWVLDLVVGAVRRDVVSAAGLRDGAGGLAVLDALDPARAALDGGQQGLASTVPRLRGALAGFPWGEDVLGLSTLSRASVLVGSPLAALALGPSDPGPATGVLDGLVHASGLTAVAAKASPIEDGPGTAVPTGGFTAAPPRSLGDLLAGLDERNRTGVPGGIDVRVLTGADGRRRVVVDITGTRVWHAGGTDVADLTTNELALHGRRTAYEDGVLAALRDAGVRRDDDVMLVGHSQGGMVAVTTAATAARTGEFHVTHVVTAGSPVARTVGSLPPSVQVLALENTHDVVPAADGRPNPDRRNVTTVSAPLGVGAHGLPVAYRPLAQRVDTSDDRSVRTFLRSGDGFLTAEHADGRSYRVERR